MGLSGGSEWEGWREELSHAGLQQPRVIQLYKRVFGSFWNAVGNATYYILLMKSPTHQHRKDQSHEPTAENSEGHHVGHE